MTSADTAPAFQVTFDTANPESVGRFWAAVLGYVEQPPPDGHPSWNAFLDAMDVPADERDTAYAVVDPAGKRPRLLFLKVPEGKTAKKPRASRRQLRGRSSGAGGAANADPGGRGSAVDRPRRHAVGRGRGAGRRFLDRHGRSRGQRVLHPVAAHGRTGRDRARPNGDTTAPRQLALWMPTMTSIVARMPMFCPSQPAARAARGIVP